MPGSVYLKTLYDLRGLTLAWSLFLAALAAANVLFYPTVQGMPDFISLLEQMPSAFKALIGDVRTMSQLDGFLRVKFFDPLPLLLSIFVISQGAGLIAGEIEHKSFDLLLARPIARWRVALEKFLALVTATVVMTGTAAAGLIISVRFIETDLDAGYLFASTANSLPLTWLFGAVAMMGSCLLPRARHAAILAGFVVVSSYVFETFRVLSPVLHKWDEVSLFAIQKSGISLAGEMHFGPIVLLLGLVILMMVVAAVAFERRDLAS